MQLAQQGAETVNICRLNDHVYVQLFTRENLL